MGSRDRTSSFDIAYLAGVSQPTVSRALRGSPLVSEETRRKVLKIAAELNYKVDKNASNLRNQVTGTLALLFFEDPSLDDSLINPFFFPMLGSITRACGQRGYDLLVSYQQFSSDWHADFEDSKKADGLILLGYGDDLTYQPRLFELLKQRTHFVRWGAVVPEQPWVSIGSDNRQGGFDMTQHLLERGRKRIAFLGNATEHYPEFSARYQGYREALEMLRAGFEPALHVDVDVSSEQAGSDAVKVLLKRKVKFDAIFAASDLIAIGAMRELKANKKRIPQDISVAGFDDLPIASLTNPALSTVAQNTQEAGVALVDSLIALVRGQKAKSQTIPTSLRLRASTA